MKSYVFSIVVRGFLAVSGFLVFILSAKLFGADGRGVISYGTSIFASIGILMSLNLGRTFVANTNQRGDDLRREYLPAYLALNFSLVVATAIIGILFWIFSSSAQAILHLDQILALSATSFFYVWSINGNFFFSSFLRTKEQELIIFATRFLLIVGLVLFVVFGFTELTHFLIIYSVCLALGTIAENLILIRIVGLKFDHFTRLGNLKKHLVSSLWPHLDFLFFNLYPLILIVTSGFYLKKSDIGRANFAIQIINMIFLFATTANIRISSYVSDSGYQAKRAQLKKLFKYTFLISVLAAIVIYFGLHVITLSSHFESFAGVEKLFLISILSIPGYIFYQFLNPIWLEINKIKESAILNFINFSFWVVLSPVFLSQYKETGILLLFSGFHIGLLILNLLLFKRNFSKS